MNKQIADVSTQVQALQGRLVELRSLSRVVKESPAAYARGELTLAAAAALVMVSHEDREARASILRKAVKIRLEETPRTLAGPVGALRKSRLETLDNHCRTLEKAERQASALAGIGDDLFTPSSALQSFRSQAAAARRELPAPVTLTDLVDLGGKVIDPVSPTEPELNHAPLVRGRLEIEALA